MLKFRKKLTILFYGVPGLRSTTMGHALVIFKLQKIGRLFLHTIDKSHIFIISRASPAVSVLLWIVVKDEYRKKL